MLAWTLYLQDSLVADLETTLPHPHGPANTILHHLIQSVITNWDGIEITVPTEMLVSNRML